MNSHPMLHRTLVFILAVCLILNACKSDTSRKLDGARRIEILFLGNDATHHNAAKYLPLLASTLSKEGINFTYTSDPADLNDEVLKKYDGLVIYANHDSITANQEKALLDFVDGGKGFIPIHCASFCFQNSPKYIDLVGGQFLKHDTGTFTARIINKEHPVTASLNEFATWDETYVHDKLTSDRTILMERVEGDHHEPWTWVKQHGKGRVFYTAYGHDERTWNTAGFQQLIKQGITWAVGDAVKKQWEEFRAGIPVLVYRDEKGIPNYEKRDPWPKYQEPLSPQESQKLIQVPVGFDLELFASEPDIINPIAMDWDERGRLWVIETIDYPNTKKDNGTGDDRIKICEDTDGDGRADKFTVFADSLNIPTSFAFSHGGIIVSQAPYFLFLQDTDGNDKADVRKILYEGWGTYDTHAGPSNLRNGMDNHVWGVVGYSGFAGTMGGDSVKFSQGLYRFNPDATGFEFVTSTSNNTWGLGFTEANDVFASTANNTHSVFAGIPNSFIKGVEGASIAGSVKIDGHYAMHPVTEKVRQVDVFGGFTAAAGHNFYTARAYPKEFWNGTAFVCEPTGHLVHMARIVKDGAGFTEKDGWNFFAGADEWVSPVEAKVGPDGAVWVLDWYDFIIQHNPTPTPERGGYEAKTGAGNAYENPLRDKDRGRIWRVVHQDAKAYKPLSLDKKDPDGLIKALHSDNMFWRMTAQRLLVERANTDVLSQLYAIADESGKENGDTNYAALHALWTIQGLGVIDNEQAHIVLTKALKNNNAAIRKAAIEILTAKLTEEEMVSAGILKDKDPNTRLSALLALTGVPASESLGRLLYDMSLEPAIVSDPWLSKAVYIAASHHKAGFLAAYLKENKHVHHQKAPEKNREDVTFDDTSWKSMALPQTFEQAGLDIDGIVWFKKAIQIPKGDAGKKALISLGRINDSDDTYLNGKRIGGMVKANDKSRVYAIAPGMLKSGLNIISIKVEDIGGFGGFQGKKDELFIEVAGRKTSLSGDWKYDIEKEYNTSGKDFLKDMTLGQVFAEAYMGATQSPEIVTSTAGKDATVITIKVVQNKMKFDLQEFTVIAGKPVEIILQNPDFMQHNIVISKPGTKEVVGKAADKIATNPKGAEMNYVPNIPEVLFATNLVNPQETVRLQFIAPASPGDYPFLCTFPGHWSVMNGTMKVIKNNSPN